jgi:enoyl-CoA hydratase/carnithine racemase
MSEDHVIGEKKNGIYYVTLNRPAKRNAMLFEMLPAICEQIEEQILDPEIRVIIIKGEGKVFSAGVDFNSLGTLVGRWTGDQAAGGAMIRADIHKYQQFLNRIEAIEIPVICAMHGAVFGMALELALACDIRLMSDDCVWGLPELTFGLVADLGGTSRLSRIIGPSRAMEVLMTGKKDFTAQAALEWGLINHVYPAEVLISEAEALAQAISRIAPIAVGATKKIIKRGEGGDIMTQLEMEVGMQSILVRSEDFQEGVLALMEGRTPNWKRK